MNATLLSEPPHPARPISAVKTVLVVGRDDVMRQLLSNIIRKASNYRVLEASSTAEGRYLTAVEGRINLVLADALSDEHLEFAEWFLTVHPESMVLVADDSLWEIIGGPHHCEQVLMAKSYTLDDLVLRVRQTLSHQECYSF